MCAFQLIPTAGARRARLAAAVTHGLRTGLRRLMVRGGKAAAASHPRRVARAVPSGPLRHSCPAGVANRVTRCLNLSLSSQMVVLSESWALLVAHTHAAAAAAALRSLPIVAPAGGPEEATGADGRPRYPRRRVPRSAAALALALARGAEEQDDESDDEEEDDVYGVGDAGAGSGRYLALSGRHSSSASSTPASAREGGGVMALAAAAAAAGGGGSSASRAAGGRRAAPQAPLLHFPAPPPSAAEIEQRLETEQMARDAMQRAEDAEAEATALRTRLEAAAAALAAAREAAQSHALEMAALRRERDDAVAEADCPICLEARSHPCDLLRQMLVPCVLSLVDPACRKSDNTSHACAGAAPPRASTAGAEGSGVPVRAPRVPHVQQEPRDVPHLPGGCAAQAAAVLRHGAEGPRHKRDRAVARRRRRRAPAAATTHAPGNLAAAACKRAAAKLVDAALLRWWTARRERSAGW